MAVFDVDGDGDSDVVSALAAHQYGLSWFEQVSATQFTPHEVLPPNATAPSFSQQHALSVGDLNGDGLPDFVTGKRYYAQPTSNADPGTTDPPVLYWFELSRSGGAKFTPRLIHNDSGAGCNFAVRDVTGDGKLDVFVTNKRGTFLHTDPAGQTPAWRRGTALGRSPDGSDAPGKGADPVPAPAPRAARRAQVGKCAPHSRLPSRGFGRKSAVAASDRPDPAGAEHTLGRLVLPRTRSCSALQACARRGGRRRKARTWLPTA